MPTNSRIYWDSSCFISLLNASERRVDVCRDVLSHAQSGAFEVWTSTFTIAEVIRPKQKYEQKDLPAWSVALRQTDEKGNKLYPDAEEELTKIWDYYQRQTVPSRKLEPQIALQVKSMFAWDYLHLVQVTPAIALHASDLSRDFGLRPADAVHVASALDRKCSQLQRFDRDFNKVQHLIELSEPTMITQPPPLFRAQ